MERIGWGDGGCGSGGVRRVGVRGERTIGMDGWMGSDGVADRLEHRQSSSGTLPQSRVMKKERARAQGGKEKAEPAVEETWQSFPSFVCLARGCSARGNQVRSRHGGGGGGRGQALLLRLRKDKREREREKKKYFQTNENSAS